MAHSPHSPSTVLLLKLPLVVAPSLLLTLALTATVVIPISPSRVVLLQFLEHLALASCRGKSLFLVLLGGPPFSCLVGSVILAVAALVVHEAHIAVATTVIAASSVMLSTPSSGADVTLLLLLHLLHLLGVGSSLRLDLAVCIPVPHWLPCLGLATVLLGRLLLGDSIDSGLMWEDFPPPSVSAAR